MSPSRKAAPTLEALRRHALARSLAPQPSLPKALARMGFVQADPLRAPARAQDLTLRQRVAGYRAGDLEARYARLGIEEDFFINYGFMARGLSDLMHPRAPLNVWTKARWAQAQAVLDFVRERGVVHPRDVDAAFQHGSARNWFGGTGRASTQLLEGMHFRGLLRTAAREGGVRLYAARPPQPEPEPAHIEARLDQMADVVVGLYAPLPTRSLSTVLRRVRCGTPQWTPHMNALVARTLARLPSAEVGGLRWHWPEGENPSAARHAQVDDDARLRLLAPFDPVVWDRARFEALWGWAYRFEAYTPAAKRQRGHYALPLLWRGQFIGWANAAVREGRLHAQAGFVRGKPPPGPAFRAAWRDEIDSLAAFLRVLPA